jgi:CHAT domain-containing protein
MLHAAGVANLLLGRPADAVVRIEQVTRQNPDRAAAWSDLAAARHTVALLRHEPYRLPSALAAADSALRLNPRLPSAQFNRALILESLGLRNAARVAWQEALANERDPRWAAEARQHLRALPMERPVALMAELQQALASARSGDLRELRGIVKRRIEEVRTNGETVLATSWAEAYDRGDAIESARLLANLQLVGAEIAARNGDRFLEDVAYRLESATPQVRADLAKTHLAYRDARLHYRDQLPGCDAELQQVAAAFRRLQSPMAHVADFYAANAMFDRNHVDEARITFERVLREIDTGRYSSLAASAQKDLGRYYAFRGMWTASLTELSRARDRFTRLDEQINAAFSRAIVGEVYDRIGQFDKGWRDRTAAFAVLCRRVPDQRSLAVLVGAVHAEILRGEFDSALSLVEIARREAHDVGDPRLTTEMMVRQARILSIGLRSDAARDAIRLTKQAAAAIADPRTRLHVEADIAIVEGEIERRTDPARAVAILTPAIEFYEANGFSMLLPGAYLERGRARLACGDRESALIDFQAGLGEIERQRANVAVDIRTTIFDTVPDLIAETVDLLLESKKDAEAFGVVERARARTLIEALGVRRGPAGEAGIHAIATALPAGGVLIEYALLPREIAAFCITRKGLTVVRLKTDRRALRQRADDLNAAIDGRQPIVQVQQLAAMLHAELIAPLEPLLTGAKVLYIVPDRFLYATPFAALFDRGRGEYLIEQRRIVIVPSAALLLRVRRGPSPTHPALIVSDPANETAAAHLPGARREAAAVAQLYPGSLLLEGREATVGRFLAAARDSVLIHYAGHAGADDTADGFLPLAATSAADGSLDATAISRMALRHTNLVVLSACATMRGSTSRVEGMPSVSRGFLTAGATAVLGMLWEIDDESAAALLLSFHSFLPHHQNRSGALQAAQLSLLHSRRERLRHPASWAAAVLFGAD